jgi:hypothetical protein
MTLEGGICSASITPRVHTVVEGCNTKYKALSSDFLDLTAPCGGAMLWLSGCVFCGCGCLALGARLGFPDWAPRALAGGPRARRCAAARPPCRRARAACRSLSLCPPSTLPGPLDSPCALVFSARSLPLPISLDNPGAQALLACAVACSHTLEGSARTQITRLPLAQRRLIPFPPPPPPLAHCPWIHSHIAPGFPPTAAAPRRRRTRPIRRRRAHGRAAR